MPFGSGARPLTSSLKLPTPGLIVAQQVPLHYYYALANEMQEDARQWAEAQAQVTPKMASDLAEMTIRYPDLPASVLTGAVAGGVAVDHPAMISLNDRMGYARTLDPIRTATSSLLDVPFDFIRGGVRLATTIFMSLYEEVVPRHTRQLVGMSQGMSPSEAREASGDSVGLRAWNTFWNDPVGNLTPAASSPEGQVNLGSGWLPQSNIAESDDAEVQMLTQMGIPEANAIAQVQQGYGDPLTQLAYEQHHTGITFEDGLSISPGRLAAKSIGLEAGTMPFHIVSGAADFGSQIFLDPTNLALWGLGKARLANKMLVGGGARRGILGVHADEYVNSPAYWDSNEVLSKMGHNEDVANALGVKTMTPGIEGFSTRTLVGDVTDARTAQAVDKVRRPYFGASGTDGLPMITQVPTPRSILNPSGSRRTMGQILGGQYPGEAGDIGRAFGLKAAVHHNLEGSWAGRMFSQMGGKAVMTDNLDRGYEQFRGWMNSAGASAKDSHPFLQAFARLKDGDRAGALVIVGKAKKWFVDNKIPGAPDEVKNYILKSWNRMDADRGYWLTKSGANQWFPDIEVIGFVDDELITISKSSQQMVDELFNNTIMLPDPRHIRRALSNEGFLKVAKITSHAKKIEGTDTAQLIDQAWLNVLDGYMQKVWKPLVLLRVAWPVRVVFEEQLRMAASGLDSMFSHPISWFAYAFGGKMNQTLLGESLEAMGRKGAKGKYLLDFNPQGTFDEFQTALQQGGGGWLDTAGRSLGEVRYVNVFRDDSNFVDAWLWNLGKSHHDPVMTHLRANGIDDTVDWLMKKGGQDYLKQLVETANPVKTAFFGSNEVAGVTAARLRWYVEGLHARSVALTGGDYVYWNPHVQSALLTDVRGGWLSSADRPLTPDEITKHGLDPMGPKDPSPIPKRPKPDGGTGPSPIDGIPEGGNPPQLGSGPSGTQPLPFGAKGAPGGAARGAGDSADIERLITEREAIVAGINDLADPAEAQRYADKAKELETEIKRLRAEAAVSPSEPIIQARIGHWNRPYSSTDPVRNVTAASGKAKDKAYNTMGYQMNTGGYDADRAFAELYNQFNGGRVPLSIDEFILHPNTDFNSEVAAIDDIARFFIGPDGIVDDAKLTEAFSRWAVYADIEADDARYVSEWMVESINLRHQQQLDLLNYVYPGRLSQRGNILAELTDAEAYYGIRLINEGLTPEQAAELRFIHRFVDELANNETGWGRDATMIVSHILENYGDEFVRLNYDSPLINRILAASEMQRTHNRPINLHDLDPSVFGKPVKEMGDKPLIIIGFASVEGGADNLGLYTHMASGRASAAITINDYTTMDLSTLLEYAVKNVGEARLRGIIEDLAIGTRSAHEHHNAVAQYLVKIIKNSDTGRGVTPPGPNGAWVFQGQISDANPMLKGVSAELRSFFNDMEGAWFDRTPTGTLIDQTERRVIIGGYDGVWSATDRARLVNAFTEGGTFTDQGGESLAKVIEVLQARDHGLTAGWLDKFGQEIAATNLRANEPLRLMSLHQLDTKTTKELADELVRLAAGFSAKEVAADDIIRVLKPGASVDAFTGVEARVVEISKELGRRLDAGFDRGYPYAEDIHDAVIDAVQRYAQFSETSTDDLFDAVNWLDEIADEFDWVLSPTRATWPRHMMDEFDQVSQPHLYADVDGWKALPDEAEVWVFHGTDQATARKMLVDGIDPRDKPVDKLSGEGLILSGRDTGTYVTSDALGVHWFAKAAAQARGYGDEGVVIAIRVRKMDLRPSTESTDWLLSGSPRADDMFRSLDSGSGAVFDVTVPAGNVKMFSTDVVHTSTPDDLAIEMLTGHAAPKSMESLLRQNIEAGANLSDDAAAAVRLAEKAGYRVEVVSTTEHADIWIMDRDLIIRIQSRDEDGFAKAADVQKWLDGLGGDDLTPNPNLAPERPPGWVPSDAITVEKTPDLFIREYLPNGGYRVIDDPNVNTVSDAVVAAIGDGETIPWANAPRPGFRYMLEQPYGSPRFRQSYGPHYADGSQIDIDNLSIMGVAKTKLKATLPDTPKPPEVPPPAPKPLAIGPGEPRRALEAPGGTPPEGFPMSGGINDPQFQGNYYKITEGPNPKMAKAADDGVILDPATGEDMSLFPSGTVENYAADMEGLPARHAALNEHIDSAPPAMTMPDPQYAPNQAGVWDKALETMFHYLMGVPTNKLSRGPAFKQYYVERVLHLRSFADDVTKGKIDTALKNDLGISDFERYRRNPVSEFFTKAEVSEGVSMTFEQIDQMAKGYALEHTRELLYDLSKRHDASDILRNIFPFAEAWGEIITAWTKIMWENPRMFRRAQQGVEAAREQGWFYQDQFGQEVFAYPGSEFVTKAMLGTGDKTEVKFTGTTAGVNLALGQYIPGFGPIVQVPASMLIPNMPNFDSVREFLNPYGDEEVQTPGDIANLGLPAWWNKVLIAIGTGGANFKRLHNNTVMDVYKILAAEDPQKLNNAATSYALMEEASQKASALSWIRALAAVFSPTSPMIEYDVKDSEGTMWQMQAMTAEYYRLLRINDFDQQVALESFIQRFGFGEGLLDGLGVASVFITAKSIKVQERSSTTNGFAWQRDNADLFEPGAYPYTAAYAMQDLEWDDFDYTAYLDTLKQGTREGLTPDEWLMRRNRLVGNIAYDVAKQKVEGRTDQAASLWKRDIRIKLANEYPGFGPDVKIVGLPQQPDTGSMIAELERWVDDPRLDDSNAGQGVTVYLALRRRAEAEAYNRGLMPDSWRSANSMVEWRQWLRQSAEAIMQVFPEFGQLWFDIFKWELTEDETPEVLALGGMTF